MVLGPFSSRLREEREIDRYGPNVCFCMRWNSGSTSFFCKILDRSDEMKKKLARILALTLACLLYTSDAADE